MAIVTISHEMGSGGGELASFCRETGFCEQI